MFESRFPIAPSARALTLEELQQDYLDCWKGYPREFSGA
jgi:homogentisate 1,2-dioxygenase